MKVRAKKIEGKILKREKNREVKGCESIYIRIHLYRREKRSHCFSHHQFHLSARSESLYVDFVSFTREGVVLVCVLCLNWLLEFVFSIFKLHKNLSQGVCSCTCKEWLGRMEGYVEYSLVKLLTMRSNFLDTCAIFKVP